MTWLKWLGTHDYNNAGSSLAQTAAVALVVMSFKLGTNEKSL